MDLWVFDMEFNRLGIIDDYQSANFEPNYYSHSLLHLTIGASPEIAKLLLLEDDSDKLRIITKSTDENRGYIIETAEYTDEDETLITVIAKSLSGMAGWRQILGQQTFSGNVEDVLKGFVNINCIVPENPNRIIPNLVLGINEGIDITFDASYANVDLDVALWEMCEQHEMSFEILMNHDAKKYVFSTFKGADRSTLQDINPHVIFAKVFDNVVRQSYVDDKANYRSTAYVGGQGEGVDRFVGITNDDKAGYYRREIFFDENEVKKRYRKDGYIFTMTDEEYLIALGVRGENRLVDYQRIRSFESDIDAKTQCIFNEDYFLGDIVSNRNDDLNIVMHTRVVSASEIYSRDGYELSLTYGTVIPTLLDKIKREVK